MADLELKPDFVFNEQTKYKTLVSEFENGTEQRRAIWGSSIQQWKLQYANRTLTEKNTLQTLFDNSFGRAVAFTWTHPVSGATIDVRFLDDSFETSNKAFGLYDIEFSLIQVK